MKHIQKFFSFCGASALLQFLFCVSAFADDQSGSFFGGGGFSGFSGPLVIVGAIVIILLLIIIGMLDASISRRKLVENELKRERDLMGSIMETSPVGIIVLGSKGEITFANDLAARVHGMSRREILGRPHNDHIWKIVTHDGTPFPEDRLPFNRVMELRSPVLDIRMAVHWMDGRRVLLSVNASPLFGDDGKIEKVVATVEDITTRKRVEEALKESAHRFRSLVKTAESLIILLSPDRKILEFNRMAEEFFGCSRHEVLGRNFFELFLPESIWIEASKSLKKVLSGFPVRMIEYPVCTKEGEERLVQWSMSSLQDAKGDSLGVLAVGQDVTEQKASEVELRKARDAAEEANKAKSEFLANMSHEIRTPISAIMGMTEMAINTDLNDDQRSYLNTVKRAAESLLHIINDILDLSKIEARKMELRYEDFDLHAALAKHISVLRVQAEGKGIELRLVIDAGVSRCFNGDEHRLGQIITNLVGNAIKFTDKGYVELSVFHAGCWSEGEVLEFRVRDTGIGIADDKKEKLFESFVQLNSGYSKSHSGSGLGLAISRQLVQMMGGEIDVTSREGWGSEFRFTVMLKHCLGSLADFHTAEEQIESLPAEEDDQTVRILLAEDNATNQLYITHFLSEKGFEVETADNGLEVLNAIEKKNDFDLILMDVQMPEMDGMQATQELRSRGIGLPIVALTAYAMEGDRERFLDSGMDDYASKPVNIDDLIEIITKVLSEAKSRRQD
jgi:hypothetical protein